MELVGTDATGGGLPSPLGLRSHSDLSQHLKHYQSPPVFSQPLRHTLCHQCGWSERWNHRNPTTNHNDERGCQEARDQISRLDVDKVFKLFSREVSQLFLPCTKSQQGSVWELAGTRVPAAPRRT